MNIKIKKNNLKITIITVCYNSEKTIRKTLESIESQAFKKIEHIIVDGKSTDNTLSIIKEYSFKRKIISEHDKGIYDAMNKGIKLVEGDIIGFLNSDDFYANNDILSKVSSIFKNNPSLDACYADVICTDRNDISKDIRYAKSSKFTPGLFSKGWCPPHPTFFVRSSVYEQFGNFNLNYHIASDVELMMRFIEVHKINVRYIPELWIKMRMGGTSNNSFKNIFIQNKEILHALNSHNLPNNLINFFFHKIISRSLQFLKK
jgi:glycosyltransferase involved in cell wall biosynthesis